MVMGEVEGLSKSNETPTRNRGAGGAVGSHAGRDTQPSQEYERSKVAYMLRRSVQASKHESPNLVTCTRGQDMSPGSHQIDPPKRLRDSSSCPPEIQDTRKEKGKGSPAVLVGSFNIKENNGQVGKRIVGFDEEGEIIEFVSDAAAPTVVAPAARPMPPVDSQVPGAFRIMGPNLDAAEDMPLSDEDSIMDGAEDLPTSSDDPDVENLVAAHLVDTEEEILRIRELEEQNRMLRERETTAVVASVVGTREIVQRFFNFRDPEFRRQRVCAIVFILLALVAVAVPLALASGRRGPIIEPPSPTPVPTPEPTSYVHGELSEFLADLSFDGGAALVDQSTPQYEAVKWLANNANLSNYSNDDKIQRYVLATLFFSTQGSNWTTNDNWLGDGLECEGWSKDIECTSNGEVRLLSLENKNLQGTLPPELGLLSNSLSFLRFSENELTGTIPSEYQYLTFLTSLGVDDNSLNGTIMTEFGLLTRLSFLGMGNNQFSGTIPTEVALLTNLQTFRLGNNLNGTIPPNVGKLTSLTELSIGENQQLRGTIPSTIGHLTHLTELALYYNYLSGTIPSTIGLLTSLEFLYLDENRNLNGTIPSEIENLTSLSVVQLFINKLSGTIPSTIGLLTNLVKLEIDGNILTGQIPSEVGRLGLLEGLLLYENVLSETIPSEISLMSSLETLYLYDNLLTGNIPNAIGNLTNLERLSLRTNKLTGTIPSVINDMDKLTFVILYDNNLTGPFSCSPSIPRCRISCEYDTDTCRVL